MSTSTMSIMTQNTANVSQGINSFQKVSLMAVNKNDTHDNSH